METQDFKARAAAGYQQLLNIWNPADINSGGIFWHAANALEVTVDYRLLMGGEDSENAVEKCYAAYANLIRYGNNIEHFDDQGWWGLAFAKAAQLTTLEGVSRDQLLHLAFKIWNTIKTDAWDNTFGGGCWWSRKEQYKNAITNELFFTLSMRLYQALGKRECLQAAIETINWFVDSGMITESGLIIDGLNEVGSTSPGGTTNHRKVWTYNQGVILGGLTDLAIVLNEEDSLNVQFSPLALAQKIANGAVTQLVFPDGVLQEKACEEQADGKNNCNSNNAQFKGVFMRYIIELNQSLPSSPYQGFILQNAESVWINREKSSNAFGQVWNAHYNWPEKVKPRDKYVADLALQTSGLDALIAAVKSYSLA